MHLNRAKHHGEMMATQTEPTAEASATAFLKRNWLRAARPVSVALALLAIGLLAWWTYSLVGGHISWGLTVGTFGCGALQLVVRYFEPGVRLVEKPDSLGAADTPLEDLVNLYRRSVEVLATQKPECLSLLTDLILQPVEFRSRIVESVSLTRRSTERRVAMDLSIPSRYGDLVHQGTKALFPVFVPKKGRLYSNSIVTNGEGGSVNILAQRETQEVAGAIVLALLRDVGGLSTNVIEWSEAQQNVAGRLLELIIQTARQVRLKTDTDINATILKILSAYADRPRYAELRDLTFTLTTRYLVLAEVALAPRLRLVNSYTLNTRSLMVPNTARSHIFSTRLLQELLDMPSALIRIPLAHARKTQSYHLYVTVPDGSYIGPTGVFKKGTRIPVWSSRRSDTTRSEPYLRRPARDGSQLHLYGRGLIGIPESDVEIRGYERPSGSELFGACALIAATVLAFVFRAESQDIQSATDVATAALTLPVAIVTVALLFQPAVRRALTVSTAGIMEGILAATGILIMTIALLVDISTRVQNVVHFQAFWHIAVTSATCAAALAVAVVALRSVRFRIIQSRNRSQDH